MDQPLRPPLPITAYVDAIRAHAGVLAGAAVSAGPDAKVPTCPDWTVRDLVRHLGGVHRWATSVVATPRTEPFYVDLAAFVGTWPSDDELATWLSTGAEALAATLEAAPTDLECFTFLKATSPLAMWSRRQAHETAIHRVDGETAKGAGSMTFDPAFAADGIDELLACFITRRGGLTSEPARTMHVTATDADGDWYVQIGPEGVTTTTGGAATADVTVRGPASDIYQALWNRPAAAPLDVSGDGSVLELFLDKVHVRWG